MTEQFNQEWQDSLAGKANAKHDNAERLRAAILNSNSKLLYTQQELEQGLSKLKFEMRKEGLIRTGGIPYGTFSFVQLGLAASVFLVCGMVIQAYLIDQNIPGLADSNVQTLGYEKPTQLIQNEGKADAVSIANKYHQNLSLPLNNSFQERKGVALKRSLAFFNKLESDLNSASANYTVRQNKKTIWLTVTINESTASVLRSNEIDTPDGSKSIEVIINVVDN